MKRTFQLFLVFGLTILVSGCGDDESPDPCATPIELQILVNAPPTFCGASDGLFEVLGIGGSGVLEYSIDGITFQESTLFENLPAGTYTVLVKDENNCMAETTLTILPGVVNIDPDVVTTPDTDCLDGNGTATVQISGGSSPFQYVIGSTQQTSNTFDGLKHGLYQLTIIDDNGCSLTEEFNVERGDTGISYSTSIQSIITNSCAITGCHNGDDGSIPNWETFSEVQAYAEEIKIRTGNGTMPPAGGLTSDEIDLIACWVDDGAKDN